MFEKLAHSKYLMVLIHILVWGTLLLLPFMLGRPGAVNGHPGFGRPDFPMADRLPLFSLVFNLLLIPMFYINAYWLVPRFLNRKNWPLYIFLAAGLFLLILGLNTLVKNLFGPVMPFPSRILLPIGGFIFTSSIAFSLIDHSFRREKLRQETESEHLKTELSFLRSQLSPHFLLNTLNNIVALARMRSELLESALIKLSGLMQYMLYETDEDRIELAKEIEYLENYIELQSLRFDSNVRIRFDKEVPPDADFEIVPMVLIPFVENAFKHGVVYIDAPEIDIRLQVEGRQLRFFVRNRFNLNAEEKKDSSSGIGLNNVRRRLDLLYPDGEHELEIRYENVNWHVVRLTIRL